MLIHDPTAPISNIQVFSPITQTTCDPVVFDSSTEIWQPCQQGYKVQV